MKVKSSADMLIDVAYKQRRIHHTPECKLNQKLMFWKKRKSLDDSDDIGIAPEWTMTFHEIVRANGFESEEHQVTTEDGYILTMHRVYKKNQEGDASNTQKGKAVFMQHGFLDSSLLWVINEPDYAPAFMLANEGYDVWLGNNRGTTYSRKHVALDADKDNKYWDFSWAEQGEYDAPA